MGERASRRGAGEAGSFAIEVVKLGGMNGRVRRLFSIGRCHCGFTVGRLGDVNRGL